MKINIFFYIKDNPWGGGNQFLKGLRKALVEKGVYCEKATQADALIVNSHHYLKKSLIIKYRFPNKLFVHRIDGPISLIRSHNNWTDSLIFSYNNLFADGTIFQSNWSKEQCIEKGLIKPANSTIIHNAPDPSIFYKSSDFKPKNHERIKILASSWSSNVKKGFHIYTHLDNTLDFSKYEMTFVGRSPVNFKNIKMYSPMDSKKLAEIIKEHDIFITASSDDPCSNSLIEALCCGLPALAIRSGGHPEIVKESGMIFNSKKDVIESIEKISNNLNFFQNNISVRSLSEVADAYIGFTQILLAKSKEKKLSIKKVTAFNTLKFFQKHVLTRLHHTSILSKFFILS